MEDILGPILCVAFVVVWLSFTYYFHFKKERGKSDWKDFAELHNLTFMPATWLGVVLLSMAVIEDINSDLSPSILKNKRIPTSEYL